MTRHGFLRALWRGFLFMIAFPLRAVAQSFSESTPPSSTPDTPSAKKGMIPQVKTFRKIPLPVTPTPEFYVEDISGIPHSIKKGAKDWTLSIQGKVDTPLTLTYQDLLKFPQVKQTITLNCIGNPIGGGAIGNAEWEGVSLRELIEKTKPDFFANTLTFTGEDDYYDSHPLSKAFHPGAILALKMNGKPLTPDHGYPVRLLIPGFYGIKQVKWIRSIEVGDQPSPGYWNKRGWTQNARVQIFSRIDSPTHREWVKKGDTVIKGIAFAGDRGIEYVQVSTDGERSWNLAKLEKPMSPYSWVFWSYQVRFSTTGKYRMAVRAADGFSGIQRDDHRDPFPSGVSGVHRIEVLVL